MPSVPVKSSIIIERFIDDVFDYLVSPEFWRTGGLEIEAPLDQGSVVKTNQKAGPFNVEVTIEVMNYARPYRLGVRVMGGEVGHKSRRRGPEPLEQEYELQSAPAGARVTLTHRQKFRHPLVAPVALVLSPLLWFGLRRGMRKLKAQIESA